MGRWKEGKKEKDRGGRKADKQAAKERGMIKNLDS